jgi:hypothetical protein
MLMVYAPSDPAQGLPTPIVDRRQTLMGIRYHRVFEYRSVSMLFVFYFTKASNVMLVA